MHRATSMALLGIISGVVIGELSSFSTSVAVVTFFLGVATISLYFFERKQQSDNTEARSLFLSGYIGIICISILFGIVRTQFEKEKNNLVCEQACTFEAQVVSLPREKDTYQIFNVLPDVGIQTANVQIKVPLYPKFHRGDMVTLSGEVQLPKQMTQKESGKPFDYVSYLALHSVGSEMFYPKIEISTTTVSSKSVTSFLESLRQNFISTISLYVDEPSASLAAGMLFGNQTMSQELTQTFRIAGLSHIVVLSGFNIAVLISFVLFLCMFMPLVLRVFFASVFVIFFVLMVGAEVSIIRATLMSYIALLALLLGRAYRAQQALLLSLIIIIIYEPKHLLYDVSLHLSFLATAGIIYLQETFSVLFKKVTSKTYQEILTTTSAAYLATLPYIMYTFGSVSVYALITNILILPLVPLMMLMTFFVTVFAPYVHLFGLLFGYIDTLFGDYIIFIARRFEALPLASVHVTISSTVMLGMYLCIIFGVTLIKKRKSNETLLTKGDEIISQIISY